METQKYNFMVASS